MGTLEEKRLWFAHENDVEPLIGVPTVGAAPAPLPDTAPDEPQPGITAQQLAADAVDVQKREDPSS